ncbi:MAG: metal ABC transporter substrate-binding protein [Desulfocapsaceae bacterium]|nr:metal ABC transporter substrate-binding protein [Desulfocapsaceae bacterium]
MLTCKRIIFSILALLLISGAARAENPVRVVTSFSVLGDMIRNIGGNRVDVTVLVGPDGDVHAYEPTPAAARSVSEAGLVIVNGLGLEGWVDRLIKASGYKGEVAVASTGIKPRKMEDREKNGEIVTDPHAWQDLDNGRVYIDNIAEALAAADAAGATAYKAQAQAYTAKLAELNVWVKAQFAAIPEQKRRMITSHDAFGYLGGAYGIEILSPMGLSTESEPSARIVKDLIRQIREEKITAVFIENISDPRMIQQISRESGVTIGGELYSDALSKPEGPAPTYIDMFNNNVSKIVAAMKKSL